MEQCKAAYRLAFDAACNTLVVSNADSEDDNGWDERAQEEGGEGAGLVQGPQQDQGAQQVQERRPVWYDLNGDRVLYYDALGNPEDGWEGRLEEVYEVVEGANPPTHRSWLGRAIAYAVPTQPALVMVKRGLRQVPPGIYVMEMCCLKGDACSDVRHDQDAFSLG